MEIHPERSSGTVTNNIPNQQTAELTTNVMVPDGATLVIGGLMEDEDDFSAARAAGIVAHPRAGLSLRLPAEERRAARTGCPLDAPYLVAGSRNDVHGTPGAPPPGAEGPALGDPGLGDHGPDGQVPAIAPLPAAGGTGATPGAVNAQVALVAANMGVPVPGRQSSRVLALETGSSRQRRRDRPPGIRATQEGHREYILPAGSRGAATADSRNQAASGDGRNVDNSLAESRFEAGNQRPPQLILVPRPRQSVRRRRPGPIHKVGQVSR